MDKNLNLLVIPFKIYNYFADNLFSICSFLEYEHNIYILSIDEDETVDPNMLNQDIKELIKNKDINFFKFQELSIIKIPKLKCSILEQSKYYEPFLKNLIDYLNINSVINSSYGIFTFTKIKNDKFIYIYNIEENYLAINEPTSKTFINNYIENEIYIADKVMTSSKTLSKIYKKKYWINIIYLPTSANIKSKSYYTDNLLQADFKEEIKDKFNLSKSKIISCINFPDCLDIKLLFEVFAKLKTEIKDELKLLIVNSNVNNIIETYKNNFFKLKDNDIILYETDSIDEMLKCYLAADIGLLPLYNTKLSNSSFPASIIEYGFFKKFLVTYPLEELQEHNFPHIIYVRENIEKWVDAVKWALKLKWNEKLNFEIRKYNLNNIARTFERIFLKELSEMEKKLC